MLKRRKPLRRFNPKRVQKSILKTLKPMGASAKGKLKIQQRLAYKVAYAKAHGEKQDGIWVAPCQSCGKALHLNRADFSHKVPAGRGGDKGGQVQATNGIYSCRPCHEFVESDGRAREELIGSSASCAAGGLVQWTPETYRRLHLFLSRYAAL